MKPLRKAIVQIRSYFDIYNQIFVAISLLIIGATAIFDASLSVAVALFTAVYSFIAFNQMRSSDSVWARSPTVRREYKKDSESDTFDFGLRNFGPGPALYLRAHATVVPEGPEYTLAKSETPLHLSEGEFVSVLQGELTELRDRESDLYNNDDSKRIELYYTFDSLSGRQTPPDLKEPCSRSIEEVIKMSENPREERLENIKYNCSK
ncbi:hypothetical protein [Haloarchaeobius sp. TZWWS8]|uniref:hypothetical protein n=1 Tax=Haloarchaeobius sp. TZWWS8 TaxID=3446121 RepID=UPI003EC094EA